jgi:hypothetical protein
MSRRTLRLFDATATEVDELNVRDVLLSIDKKIAELNNDAVFHQNHQDAIASKLRNLNRAKTYIALHYQEK